MAQDEYENKNAGELRDILKSITGELSRQRSIQAESAAEYRKMDSIARNLQDTTMGISNLSSNELDKLKQKNQNHIKELQYQAERLARQKIGAKFEGEINESVIERLKFLGKLTIEEEAILKAASDHFEIEKSLTAEVEDQYRKRLAFEKQVNTSLGVSGAIIGSIDAVMSKLGMNSGIFKEAIQESKQAMQQAAEEAALNGIHISKTSVLMKGLAPLAKGFGKALFDPLTIITKVLDTYLQINKASVDVQHLTGQNAVAAASWGANYATAVDYLETAAALTKQTGMNAQNIFSEKVIGQAAALKKTMGLTADEAGGLATISQTTGKEVNGIVDSVVDTTSAFNKANRAAVSQGAVLREVANTSDSIKLSLGNNPEALAKAAAAATRLGLSLKDVDNIAASLTDFQSSISNELEAELLTGKDLNLEKARELALSNDLEGVSKEIFKNSSDITEFGKMNRIQQEAYAKALGLTKDQLAKMAYNKGLEAHMTEEQAAAAAGVNAEDMKRIAIQENFAQALEKIAGALAPILDLIGNILSMPLVPYILLGAVAVGKLGGSLTGVVKGFGGMYKAGKDAVLGVADLFKKGGLTTAISKLKGAFGEGAGDMVKSKSGKLYDKASPQGKMITNLSSKTGDVATEAKGKVAGKEGGTGFKDSMKNLADGLKEMGAAKVIQGILNLALAGPALVLALPSIPFLLFMGKVELDSLSTNFTSLATGLKAMSGTLMGSLALAAFGVAGLIAIPSLIFLGGIALIGEAAGVGLIALGAGLEGLGAAAATGLPFIAVGLIAALGIAMIPFAYAAQMAADAFVTLMGAVSMDNVGPMLLLGPALFGIAAGLGAIGIAGITAIPGIVGLTALAVIAPALTGLADAMGMGGESKSAGEAKGKAEEGSLAGVEAKLDALVAAVKAGGNVYMDSNKVGRAHVLGSYKSA